MSDVEKLTLCACVLKLGERDAEQLGPSLAGWALSDASDLVRARAILAWGAQSPPNQLDIADKFWRRASSPWQPYALIAIQKKNRQLRDARYRKWSGEGRFTGELAEKIQKQSFGWRKL
jgi:hypothetical protein